MSFFDMSRVPDQLTYLNGFGTLREGGYNVTDRPSSLSPSARIVS